MVKGINLISLLLETQSATLPIGFEVIKKDQIVIETKKDGQEKMKCKSRYTINEHVQQLVKQCMLSGVSFKYIFGIQSNRLIAIDRPSMKSGDYIKLSELGLKADESRRVYLKDVEYSVVIIRKVFKKGDAIQGEIYLVTNDLSLSGSQFINVCKPLK